MAKVINDRFYFNDTCERCPFAGSGNCLIFCGEKTEVVMDCLDYVK